MPLVAFRDNQGRQVRFDKLDASYSPDRWGMPLPFLKALTRQRRSYSDISITELVGPPQIRLLRERHEYAADPFDLVWSAFGSGLHQFLELRAEARAIAEEKFVAEFDVTLPSGSKRHIRLGGTADHYDAERGTLTNYKTSTVYKAKRLHERGSESVPDWVAAENCYAYLFRRYGFSISRIQVCLLLKDWSTRDRKQATERYFCTKCNGNHMRSSGPGLEHAEHEDSSRPNWYPPTQVYVSELPLWSQQDADTYIRNRLDIHLAAELQPDNRLPECTVEETWNGCRCKDWCEVAELCWQRRRARLAPKIALHG